jgi:hypothetical protein
MILYLQIGGELGHNTYIHGYPTYSPSKSVQGTFHSKLPHPDVLDLQFGARTGFPRGPLRGPKGTPNSFGAPGWFLVENDSIG